jgi:ribosome recycling factor
MLRALARSVPSLGAARHAPAPTPLLACHARHLAKKTSKRDSKKEKGKNERSGAPSGSEPAPSIDADELRQQLGRPLLHMEKEFAGMQIGRASPSMLDAVQVSSDGAEVPLPLLAKVLAQSPQLLTVSVFDPSTVDAVAAAIERSPLGLRAEQQGKVLRVPVPRPTKESREAFARQAKDLAEAAKTAVRSVRQKAMKQAKAAESKEETKRSEKLVEELTQSSVGAIDAAAKAKQKEVLTV